jgi:hypothetical protein
MSRDNVETVKALLAEPGFWLMMTVALLPLLGPLLKWLES